MTTSLAILFAIMVFVFSGELVTRLLQHHGVIYDFSKGQHNVGVKRAETFSPKVIRSKNPILYIENDPSDPLVNHFGMRGNLVEVEKPAGVYRVAVIGDSISYGFGVPLENSYPVILESYLRKAGLPAGKRIEVLNFSVNGYGLEAYREVLLKKATKFSPDIIIIGYCLNDLAPTSAVFIAVGDLMKKNASYKKIAKYSQFFAAVKFYSEKIFSKTLGEWKFRENYKKEISLEYLKDNFSIIQDSADKSSAKVLVVIFPLFTNFNHYDLAGIHHTLHGVLDSGGIRYMDLLDTLQTHPASSLRLNDEDITHPNAEGHALIGRAIGNELSAAGWLD